MSALIGAQEKHGYHVFQVKLGDPEITRDLARIDAVLERLPRGSTVLADANGGWEQNTAIDAISRYQGISTRFAGDIELLWEEPCNTYEANRKVALATSAPIVLDQCITGPELVAQACNEGLVAGIGIKCTMQGGLQRARLSRDLCIAHGMRMKVDDSWAADVGTSASLHLALAVPPELLICGVDMRPYFEQRVSDEGPRLEGSRFYPSDAPGLGLSPAPSRLGAPLALIS
jgi:L-alanine-DL-glutamate epimerase-like enolase superfamily enzyme